MGYESLPSCVWNVSVVSPSFDSIHIIFDFLDGFPIDLIASILSVA